MPDYFDQSRRKSKDVFQAPKGASLKDSHLDLPTKLTMFLKRGMGQRYYSDPEKLDSPTKVQHQRYLDDQFSKATYDKYVRATSLEIDRIKSFEDYRTMDYSPEISSALDIYADECLTKDEYEQILKVDCENSRIKTVLENLFEDILGIEHNLWNWTRNTCKFGNHFLLLDVQPGKGIVGYIPLPVNELRREEAYDGDINSVKFVWDTNNTIFDSWQVAHFRLLQNMEREPYGTSSLEAGRLIWKQLQLAEDAMLIYRITRAPERRIFYIDVGNINPDDVPEFIKSIKDEIKRTPAVNQANGSMEFKYNSMAIDEDFFIPRRNDKNTEVDTLPGASNLDEIADIEYMQQKLYTSLKIPKAYFSDEEDVNSKATLASQDFRFARTINRMQQAVLGTLHQLAIIHLYSLGFREKEQLTGFELELTNPSTQSLIEKIELWDQKGSVFNNLWNEMSLSPISYVWGAREILGFTDDQIEVILNQQFLEGKMNAKITEASQPPMPEMEGDMGMEGEGEMTDEEGNPLPDQPPEGKAYVDPETGELMENKHRISKMISELKVFDKKKKKPRNRYLLENSLVYANNMDMLMEMDKNIDKAAEILVETKSKIKA